MVTARRGDIMMEENDLLQSEKSDSPNCCCSKRVGQLMPNLVAQIIY